MRRPRLPPLESPAQRYVFAALACATGGALTAAISASNVRTHPIAAFLAAILFTGWWAGTGPAVLALALCVVIDVALPALLGHAEPFSLSARHLWFVFFSVAAAGFGTVRRRTTAELMAARDSLERKVEARTQELRRSEKYLAEAQHLSHTGCWAIPAEPGDGYYFSEEAYRIFGLDPARRLPADDFSALIHPADRGRTLRAIEGAWKHRAGFQLDYRIVRPDGEVRYVRAVGHPYFDGAGRLAEYVGLMMDVTERRRAGRALRRARERGIQARFAARLAERNRIGREMHDTLLQGFTGVSLKLLAATNRIRAPAEDVEALREVLRLAERSLAEARQAVWDIRTPPSAGSLADALRAVADEVTRGSELRTEVMIESAIPRLSREAEAGVLRVAREALVNAVRHSDGSVVQVQLCARGMAVCLTVIDDGCGFQVDPGRSYGGHWGLLGMRERAAQLGGRVRIRSAPGKGTTVRLTVPIQPDGVDPSGDGSPA
jgi:PAS domain S-box-containing protein